MLQLHGNYARHEGVEREKLQNIRNSVSRTSSDLSRAVTARQRRQENEKKAGDRKAEQQAAKGAKEMQQDFNKKAALADKVCSPFLKDGVANTFQQVFCFQDYQAFKAGEFDREEAYVIRKSESWVQFCQDKAALKSLLEIFQAQFPSSPTCVNFGGRCQAPLNNLDAACMRDLQDTLLSHTPPWVEEHDVEGSKAEACFKGISLYGFAATMSYVGPEYQAVCNLRFSFRGKRCVVIANFSDLWSLIPADMLGQKRGMWSEKYTIISFMIEVLSSDNAIARSMQKPEIFKVTTVGEGDVLFVPSGSLVMEKVLDGAPCVGLRICVPDGRSPIAHANLNSMIEQYEANIPNHDGSKLLQLWKFVRDLSTKDAASKDNGVSKAEAAPQTDSKE